MSSDGARAQRELEQALLGGQRRYTRDELAAAAGVAVDLARRLWRALGFADVPDDARVFTDGDLQALRLAVRMLAQDVVDERTLLGLTRALGQTLGRLAERQVGAFNDALLHRGQEWAPADAVHIATGLLPEVEQLTLYAWRRQLAAAGGRALAAAPDELAARRLVVGFADLVGFTALTRDLADRDLAELVDRFDGLAADTVTGCHGRIVKSLGDEVLFVAEEVDAGAEAGLRLAELFTDDRLLPPVRVGLAFGTVLTRLGDVYGAPVNLASRLTSLARPGTVLVDEGLAEALGHRPGYQLRRLRRHLVAGFGPLGSWALRRADPTGGGGHPAAAVGRSGVDR